MSIQLSLFDGVPCLQAGATTGHNAIAPGRAESQRGASTTLADSNLDKWNYHPHTAIKHEILRYNLTAWIPILATTRRPLAFVDGCAGRGRYRSGEPGSPLLMLDVMARHADQSQQFICHFVEKDRDNYDNLRAEVEAHPAARRGRIRCRFYNDSFSAASQAIVQAIRSADQPSFFFVDPFGYSDDPSMVVLCDILRLPYAEVFVNLMFMAINRGIGAAANPALARTLDKVFGSPAWRQVATVQDFARERAFVDLYRQQLKCNGARFVIPFRMGDDHRDRTLYYLVHATKHIKGAKLMKSAMAASASGGELGYAGAVRHQMSPLLDFDASTLPTYLLRTFAGQVTTFGELIAQTIEDTGTCCEKHYRQAVKALCKKGLARIPHQPLTRTGRLSCRIDDATPIVFGSI